MDDSIQWLVRLSSGSIDGPLETQEVIRKIRTGYYFGEEQISRYPSGDWHSISYEEDFFNVLLEVLEEELNDSGTFRPVSVRKTQKGTAVKIDKEDTGSVPTKKMGKAVAEDPDEKTPLVIEVKDKSKVMRGRAVEEMDQKKKVEEKPQKKRRSKKKRRNQYADQRRRQTTQKRLRLLVIGFVGLVLALVFFDGEKNLNLGSRIRLQRPSSSVKVKLSQKKARQTMKRAITAFRKDTLKNYLQSQDALVELVEKTNNKDAHAFLCMTYRELWPLSYQDNRDFRTIQYVLRKIQKIDPKSASASVCLVVYQWVSGKYNDALRIMRTQLEYNPGLIFFNQMTGDIFASKREYAQANYYFRKVRELWQPAPVWSRALLQEARMRRKLKEFGPSIRLYRKLLKENPKHSVGRVELGILEFQAFQHIDKAQDLIQSGLSVKEWVPKTIEAEAYLVLAQISQTKGDKRQSLKYAQKAFSLDSTNQEARQHIVNLGGLKALNAVTIDNVNMVYIGEQYMKMGNYTAAQAEFRAAFEANDKNAFAALRAGQALWELNQSNEAITWIQKSLNADPKFIRSYVILADYLSQRYDYINAIAALKQALRINRKHHGIYRGFSTVELRRRNYQGAIHFAKKALDLYDTDIEAILVLAKAHHYLQDEETAFQFIHRAFELDPSHEDVQATYAHIVVGLQGTQAGIEFIQDKIQQMPNKLTYRRTLGEILIEEERFDQAIEVFNEILAINSKDKKTLMIMGRILQQRKKFEEARGYLLEAASLDPSDAEPLFLTGQLYLEGGQNAFALKYFESVINVNPKYPLAYYYAGQALLKIGELDKALLMAQHEKKLNPDIPEPYLLAADVYSRQRQFSSCTEQYQEAITKGYDTADAYIKLARCQRLSGALDSSLSMLSEAEKRESGNPEVYRELGALYEMQNSIEKAIAAYNRYLSLNPQAKDQASIKAKIIQLERRGGD